jgi:hypothetical protein
MSNRSHKTIDRPEQGNKPSGEWPKYGLTIAPIQKSDQSDFQTISTSKLTLSNSFYNNALRQSQQSFLWSLIWAGVGSSAIAYATLQLYKQASEQAAACHIRLDRTSDFILANSSCEGLAGPEKRKMRAEIIRKLVE